jgi:hypothetical protein
MQACRFVWAWFLAAASLMAAGKWPLDSVKGLDPVNVKVEAVTYRGRPAVRVLDQPQRSGPEGVAIVSDSDFEDGTIEVDLAGSPAGGAMEAARGFIGIAFRLQDGQHFECFYLRPTNGRADDQLRRNHSTQYISTPEFPWQKLRSENPGVYESYTDLVPGEWTKVKIVVSGVEAKLYVNGAAQPCLIVKDLKHGRTHGKIGLWAGTGTDGYFSNLVVTK